VLGVDGVTGLGRHLYAAVPFLDPGHGSVREELSAARGDAAGEALKVFGGMEGRLIGIAQAAGLFVPPQR
jgi:hypothetical protein